MNLCSVWERQVVKRARGIAFQPYHILSSDFIPNAIRPMSCSATAKTNRRVKSFTPSAIRLLNPWDKSSEVFFLTFYQHVLFFCDPITSGQFSVGLVSLCCNMCLHASPVADRERITFPALHVNKCLQGFCLSLECKEFEEIVGPISLHNPALLWVRTSSNYGLNTPISNSLI